VTDSHHAKGADEGVAGIPVFLGGRPLLPRMERGVVYPRLGQTFCGELVLEILRRGGDECEQ